jgi:hypothetical protein
MPTEAEESRDLLSGKNMFLQISKIFKVRLYNLAHNSIIS